MQLLSFLFIAFCIIFVLLFVNLLALKIHSEGKGTYNEDNKSSGNPPKRTW